MINIILDMIETLAQALLKSGKTPAEVTAIISEKFSSGQIQAIVEKIAHELGYMAIITAHHFF